MRRSAFSIVLLLLVSISGLHSQVIPVLGKNIEPSEAPDLSNAFKSYHIFQIDTRTLKKQLLKSPDSFTIDLQLGEEFQFNLTLTPTPVQAKNYSLTQASSPTTPASHRSENKTFSGYVTLPDNGTAALTLDDYFIYGYLESDGTTWFIEPMGNQQNDLFLFYKATDVLESPRPCAFDQFSNSERQIPDLNSMEKSIGSCHVVEIAMATDWLLFEYFGSAEAVENFVLGNLNMIQSNYDNEFESEIQFQLVTLFLSDCETCDPWDTTTDPYALLQVFRNWGNSGGFETSFDVASLWSKREFDGNLVGLAWPGSLCANNRYNILQHYTANAASLRVLQAHELGHNFSAQHDEEGDFTIMAPSVTTSMDWSAASQEVINTYIDYIAENFDCFGICPAPPLPIAGMQIPVDNVCPGSIVPFIDDSESAAALSWNFGAGIEISTLTNPKVIFEEPGTYPIQLIATNESGEDTITQMVQVVPNGTKYLFHETFESFPDDWIIFNPDNNTPWLWYPVEGQSFGKYAMMIDNFNNSNSGQLDALISPAFSLEGETGISLEIDYAYARRNENQLDTFRILLSTDGGVTFPHLLLETTEDGSGNFATISDESEFFTPGQSSDWCSSENIGCMAISLDQFSGSSNVKLMFLNETGSGNNLYLDNVRVTSNCNFIEPATPDFTAETTIGCVPFTVNFIDNSSGTIDNRIWQFESGIPGFSTQEDPSAVFVNPGNYDVSLTVFNDAGNVTKTIEDFITVLPSVEAGFEYSMEGLAVNFTNNSTDADDFLWDLGNQTSSNEPNPTIIYETEGYYTVQLISSNSCSSDTLEQVIAIFLEPDAEFSVSNQETCIQSVVDFTPMSSNPLYSYQWTFEDGEPASSSLMNPEVIYNLPGNYGVELIISNPAGADTLYLPNLITVEEGPTANFEASVISGSGEVQFTNNSSGGSSYLWHFGDENISEHTDPVHFYSTEGTYPVTLIAANNCGMDTSFQTVEIIFEPTADFSAIDFPGCAPSHVQFQNESTGAEATFAWHFEGGIPSSSNEANPLVSYPNPGAFDVSLIVTNPIGSDTLSMEQFIILDTLPITSFTWNQDDLTVTFTNLSENSDNYSWDFGDNTQSNEEMPVHTYEVPGIYIVNLTSTNQCGPSVFSDTINLFGIPPGVNIQTLPTEGCIPFTLTYAADIDNADSIAWHFEGGNPEFSNELNPVVVYEIPGIFGTTLRGFNVFGETSDTLWEAVTLQEVPDAGFEFEQGGGTVIFHNTSENGTSYLWHFGDGEFSEEENPSHFYLANGIYEVQMITSNSCGNDTTTQEIQIFVDQNYAPENNEEVRVYPNPTTGHITVEFMNSEGFISRGKLELFEALGRQVGEFQVNSSVTTIILPDLPKGIYFYSISTDSIIRGWGKLIII